MKKIPCQRCEQIRSDTLLPRRAVDGVTRHGTAERGKMHANLMNVWPVCSSASINVNPGRRKQTRQSVRASRPSRRRAVIGANAGANRALPEVRSCPTLPSSLREATRRRFCSPAVPEKNRQVFCEPRRSCAITIAPEVSLSSRWTIPGRSGPPTVDNPPLPPKRCSSAATSVPLSFPAPGWTIIPAGLLITAMSLSSYRISRGIASGSTPGASGAGISTNTSSPDSRRCAGLVAISVHLHAPFVDQRLDLRAAQVGKLRDKKAIQALPRLFGWNYQLKRAVRDCFAEYFVGHALFSESVIKGHHCRQPRERATERPNHSNPPEPSPPQNRSGRNQADAGDLHQRDSSVKHQRASRVAAEKFNHPAFDSVKNEIGAQHLPGEALSRPQPDEKKKIQNSAAAS